MKIDIGESLVYSYLRHVKNCYIVQNNWKPSGNWLPDPVVLEKAEQEFARIQHHPAFVEIFKTGFDHTVKQTEIDVLGLDQEDTVYAANVVFHEHGINFGARTDTRNRVIKGLLRAYLTMLVYFPGKKHRLMFCSPKVMPNTEEILLEYFKILEDDFNDQQNYFMYISNEAFRDKVMMETLDCIQDEFDTTELFLRSFKLLTVYAEESPGENNIATEDSAESETAPQESTDTSSGIMQAEPVARINDDINSGKNADEKADEVDEKTNHEILKVKNRIPKWFTHPDQTNSKILITYLNLLEKTEKVTSEQLAEACGDIPRFPGNFAQMNNVSEKNHGKVFHIDGGIVYLWEPVREFIIQQYIEFKKSYYT